MTGRERTKAWRHRSSPSKTALKGRANNKMIRLFTALCKTLLEKSTDYEIFCEATDNFSPYAKLCPRCGTAGKLSPYGVYGRSLVSYEDKSVIDRRVYPKRFECLACGATHALLPDILTPNSPYSLRFKLIALITYFERKETVAAICGRFCIAVSTLYEWKKRLISHKELLLGALTGCKDPALSFLTGLLGSDCLSNSLCVFFHKHAFSFLEASPKSATRNRPP